MTAEPRKILISVDNSDSCEVAVQWVMKNVYKAGDELHLIHVIPRLQLAATYGAPPVDFLPYQDPHAYQQLIQKAEDFIAQRALRHIGTVTPQPVVHIVKYEVDTDSIGNVICKKAEELNVVLAVMARHNKTKLQVLPWKCAYTVPLHNFEVTNYCVHHSKKPVLVVQ